MKIPINGYPKATQHPEYRSINSSLRYSFHRSIQIKEKKERKEEKKWFVCVTHISQTSSYARRHPLFCVYQAGSRHSQFFFVSLKAPTTTNNQWPFYALCLFNRNENTIRIRTYGPFLTPAIQCPSTMYILHRRITSLLLNISRHPEKKITQRTIFLPTTIQQATQREKNI